MPWKLVGNLSGAQGPQGPIGERGEKGESITGPEGLRGQSGKDAVGVVSAVVSRNGNLVLTFSDGSQKDVGSVAGPEGARGIDGNGRDGIDGLGFDDLSVEFDGERTATLKFTRGAETKEYPLIFRVPLDRGVYSPDQKYTTGDAATFGGSLWIAQRDTHGDRPGEGNDAWRLAVKRGRDGKDFRPTPERKSAPIALR